MLKDIKEAREALYNIDGPIASPEAMKILNALMAVEVIISQKDEEIERLQKNCLEWKTEYEKFLVRENPHVNT